MRAPGRDPIGVTADREASRSAAARFFERVLRYGLVGFAVSVLYSVAVVLAVQWMPSHDATLASAIVFVLVLPLAYLGHRHIAFFDAEGDPFQPLRFALTTGSTFLISVGGMYVVTDILGWSYLLGIALNWALIPATNFLIFVFWVFRAGGGEIAGIVLAGKARIARLHPLRGVERP